MSRHVSLGLSMILIGYGGFDVPAAHKDNIVSQPEWSIPGDEPIDAGSHCTVGQGAIRCEASK